MTRTARARTRKTSGDDGAKPGRAATRSTSRRSTSRGKAARRRRDDGDNARETSPIRVRGRASGKQVDDGEVSSGDRRARGHVTRGSVGASGTPKRFLKPEQVDEYLTFQRVSPNGFSHKSAVIEYLFALFERAHHRMARFAILSSRTPTHVVNMRRLALTAYIIVSLVVENMIMLRGVQVESDDPSKMQRLRDADDPELFLRGLYTRYLPLAMLIDCIVLTQFVCVDTGGRQIAWLEDVGFLLRHLLKSIMRHPSMTLRIVGYTHPGHTFGAKQIVMLLSAPTVVMNRLKLLESFTSQVIVSLINFIIFPIYSVTLSKTLPVYSRYGRSHVSIKGWAFVTFVSPACWLYAMTKESIFSRDFLDRPKIFRRRSNALDGFSAHGGWFARLCCGESMFKARCTSQISISCEQIASAFATTEEALMTDLHGARIMITQNISSAYSSVSVSSLMRRFLGRRSTWYGHNDVLRNAARCFSRNVIRIFKDKPEAYIDLDLNEIWAWTTSCNNQMDTASRLRRVYDDIAPPEGAHEAAVYARLQVDTPLSVEIFSHVNGPLKVIRTKVHANSPQKSVVCYSNMVAIVAGSVNAIHLHGRGFRHARMYIRVGSSSFPLGESSQRMQHFDIASPRVEYTLHDDASTRDATSIDQEPLEHTSFIVNTSKCRVDCVGHLVIQIIGKCMSFAFPIVVTNDLDVKNELNERFGCVHLNNSTTLFLHAVGRALANRASASTTRFLSNVAFDNDLPHLGATLRDKADACL